MKAATSLLENDSSSSTDGPQHSPSGIRPATIAAPMPLALMGVAAGFSVPRTIPATPIRGWTAGPLLDAWREQPETCCAVVESGFGGGEGLALVQALRAARPLTPILFCSLTAGKDVLRLARSHDFELAVGAFPGQRIEHFVKEATKAPTQARERLEEWLLELCEKSELTPAEMRLATAAVRGESRSEMLTTFDVSVNTLKSHTRRLLKKTGHDGLDGVAREALKAVLR